MFSSSNKGETTPGKFRLLHNLSYPYDKKSVNFNMPKEEATAQYPKVSDAVNTIQKLGKDCYIAKSDISETFRLIPLNTQEYHIMRFTWEAKYYYGKCLPMGCSSSCRLFSVFTDAIVLILRNKYGVENVEKIVDDFFFLAKTREECHRCLNSFLELCSDDAGIPVVKHKTVGPCWCLVFLGAEIDTHGMQIRLPVDKLLRYSEHIEDIISQGKVTLRDLQSVIGQLQYATCAVNLGRVFLRRLIDLTIGCRVPHFFINLTKGAKDDLKIWKRFLAHFNGKSFMYEPHMANSNTINLFSDSSKKGYGACHRSNI